MNMIAMCNFRKSDGGVLSVYCGREGDGGAIVFVDLSYLADPKLLILPWSDDPQRDRGASRVLWQITEHLNQPTNYLAKIDTTEYEVEYNSHDEFDTLILIVGDRMRKYVRTVAFDAEDLEANLHKDIACFMREALDLAGVKEQ